jgi:hypothetical protein
MTHSIMMPFVPWKVGVAVSFAMVRIMAIPVKGLGEKLASAVSCSLVSFVLSKSLPLVLSIVNYCCDCSSNLSKNTIMAAAKLSASSVCVATARVDKWSLYSS